ncbi:MAG: hypothetical protein LUD40_16510 [Phocaeicola dorei]|nr:hypothetical protein [Phocaeicola dorei]
MNKGKLVLITYCLFLLPFIILCASGSAIFNVIAGVIIVPGIFICIGKAANKKEENRKREAKEKYEESQRIAEENLPLSKKREKMFWKKWWVIYDQAKKDGKDLLEENYALTVAAWQYVNQNLPCPEGEEDYGWKMGICDEDMDIFTLRERSRAYDLHKNERETPRLRTNESGIRYNANKRHPLPQEIRYILSRARMLKSIEMDKQGLPNESIFDHKPGDLYDITRERELYEYYLQGDLNNERQTGNSASKGKGN